jgi:hypothetical protein
MEFNKKNVIALIHNYIVVSHSEEELKKVISNMTEPKEQGFKVGDEVWIPEYDNAMGLNFIPGKIIKRYALFDVEFSDGKDTFTNEEIYHTHQEAEKALAGSEED